MSDDRGSNLSSLKRRLAALFAITAAAVIAGGVAYNNSYRASLIRDSEKLLTSIEDFKLQQITYWRKDRMNDTMSLLDSPILSAYLNKLAVTPSDDAAKALLSKHLNAYLRNNRYTEALLAWMDGKVLVSAGKRSNKVCPEAGEILAKANASGQPEMGDFNVLPGEKKSHIHLAARAAKGPGGKNLFLLLRIDPEDYLYPLIAKWPTNSRTGETQLVGRKGDKIIFLNPLRQSAGAAMKLKVPMNAPDRAAAMAFAGKPGIVRGRDYRGVEVLACVSTIPGTNWAIVTKMDMAEVLAGSGRVSLLLLLLGLFLLGTAGAGAYLIFRRQAEEYRRSYAELDRQTSALKDNYARLTAQANDAIIIADAQTLQIIETNRKSHEMYGYTEEEFLRLKISDLVPESGRAGQRERLEAVRSGAGAVTEAEHKRKNGELFPAEISSSCTYGSGKEYIFAIIRDLSERKRMEQTLRDSEENYRQLFEAESDAILLINNENGELKQANNAAAILYGYTHEELLALRNTDLSAEPEDTSKVTRTTPLDPDKVVVIPLRYHRKKSGEVFPVEITGRFFTRNGRPVHLVAIRDITERKRAEEKLRLGEERLRMAAEAAQFGVYDYDIETGARSYSPEFLELFGLPPGAALPLDADQAPVAIYPDDKEGFLAARKAGYDPLGSGLVDHEFRVILPTGLVRWLRVRGRTVFTGTGAGARPLRANGIIQDVTEKKHAELKLKESEKDLKEAQRLARIGNWEWDAGSDAITWSPEYYHLYGLDPSQPPPGYKEHLKAYTAESAARLDAAVKKSMQSGEPYELDLELAGGNGKGPTRWVTARSETLYGPDGKVTGLRGTAQDITGRKLAELELHETEEKLRSLMNSMPDIVCFKDGEGRWLEANTFDLKLFQLEGVEYKGKKDSELAPFSQFYHDAFMACEASDEKAWQNAGSTRGEEVIQRPEGSAYTFDIIKVPLFTPEGKRKALTVMGRDITKRKNAELKLKKLNQDLIDKKQEMENFLYITTHDLRGPLVNIQGFSQNLEHYLTELKDNLGASSLPPGPRESLEKLTGDRIPTALKFIVESSRKMDALLTALLKVSRMGRVEMKPETVDMNGLMDKVAESLHYQLDQAGGEVKHGDLPRCKADPGAVSQLFANLLDNAIKYRQESRRLAVRVTGEIRDGMALYSVSDNGSGIPETELGRIWDVFYRHDSSGEKSGEGIGLPMVKRLAEKNGGNITVTSRLGEGSVFCVSLPAA